MACGGDIVNLVGATRRARGDRQFHPEETAYGRNEIAHLQGLLATHAHADPDSRSALAPVQDVRHQGEPR